MGLRAWEWAGKVRRYVGVESAWKVRGCGRGKCLGMGVESAWKVRGYVGLRKCLESLGNGFFVAFHAARPPHPVQST